MKIETLKNRIEVIQKHINREDKKVWKPCLKAYEGDRSGLPEDLHDVNLVWATIRTLIPDLFFNVPRFKLTAKHVGMDQNLTIKNEALLNAIIGDKDMAFSSVIKATILAAHISFGVVTWGCNSDFLPHPMAGQPITYYKSPQEPNAFLLDTNREPALHPEKLATKDSYFIKRIRAQDFYPDLFSGETFEKLRYYAIAEFMTKKHIHDVYKISYSKMQGGISYSELDDSIQKRIQDEEELSPSSEIKDDFVRLRVYKMYDRERNKVYTFCNEIDKVMEETDIPGTEPVTVLKFNDKLDEFYPIPEIIQALSLQREIEIASSMRSEHMKRSGRKIGIKKGMLDAAQIARLEDPTSHVVIELENPTDTWPIDFGTCDSTIYSHEGVSTEQFNQVMGVGASQRGGSAPKRTATAEIIQDKRLNTRQQEKIKKVKDFLSIVGNGIKNIIDETMTLEREIEIIGPDEEPYVVQYTPTIDVDGDYDCTVELAEFAAQNEEIERAQWISLLDIFGRSPMAFSNPILTRETLKRFGIENKQLINAFMQLATNMMQMQAQQAGGVSKTGGTKGLPQGGIGAMMGNMIAGGINGGG